jgi:hypothetical protein
VRNWLGVCCTLVVLLIYAHGVRVISPAVVLLLNKESFLGSGLLKYIFLIPSCGPRLKSPASAA